MGHSEAVLFIPQLIKRDMTNKTFYRH